MDQETSCQLLGTEAMNASPPSRAANPEEISNTGDNPRSGFNRHLYDNLVANLECQIESWNQSAVRDPNPEIAHALWLKAEGLGYALRLLYAFEPEFRELVECASRGSGLDLIVSTSQNL